MSEMAPHAASGQAGEQDLAALQWNWGEAYLIGYDDEHGWWASRRDQIGGLLTEAGPDELRAAIIADYDLKRVPRAFAGRVKGEELPPLPSVRQVPEMVRLKVEQGYRAQSRRTHSVHQLARPWNDHLLVMQAGQNHDKHVEDPGRYVADPEVVDDFADLRPARECLVNREQGLARHDAGHRHQQQARDKALLQQLVEHYPYLFRVHDPAIMPHTADRTDPNVGEALTDHPRS